MRSSTQRPIQLPQCMCVCTCYGTQVEDGRQHLGIRSLLPHCVARVFVHGAISLCVTCSFGFANVSFIVTLSCHILPLHSFVNSSCKLKHWSDYHHIARSELLSSLLNFRTVLYIEGNYGDSVDSSCVPGNELLLFLASGFGMDTGCSQ